jgi:hypothetical protein
MRVIIVIVCVIIGGIVGYQVGIWWLSRTVANPELETAIYPGIGTLAGCLFGVILGVPLALLFGGKHPD